MRNTGIILFLFVHALASAQTYRMYQDFININDGLPDNQVNNCAFDKYHRLWIGTADGLSIYDGFESRNFNSSNSILATDNVMRVFQGADGEMVVVTIPEGTENDVTGLYTVSYEGEVRFTEHPAFLDKAAYGPMRVVGWDSYYNDGFYFGNQDEQIFSYSISQDQWKKLNVPDGFSVICIRDGLVIGEVHDTIVYFKGVAVDTLLGLDDLKTELPHVGYLWPYRAALGIEASDIIQFGCYDRAHDVSWISHDRSVMGVRRDGELIQLDNGKERFPLEWAISRAPLIEDDGTQILSTARGVYILRTEPQLFRWFDLQRTSARPNSDPLKPSCRGLVVRDSILYITDYGTIYRAPIDEPQGLEVVLSKKDANFIPLLFSEGKLFSGRFSMVTIDPQTLHVTLVADPIVRSYEGFWSLLVRDTTLYIGAWRGMTMVDLPSLLRGEKRELCADTTITAKKLIYQYAPIDEERTFIVTSEGLFVMNERECRVHRVQIVDRHGSLQNMQHFTSVDDGGDGNWWVTTLDAGAMVVTLEDTVAHIQRSLDMEDGIVTNAMYASYDDGLGFRWISTDQGLIRLRLNDWTFYTYTTDDGLPGNEFNRMSYTRDVDGNFYFGGLDGVIAFNPSDFPPIEDTLHISLLDFEQYSGWRDTLVNRAAELRATGKILMQSADKFFRMKVGFLDYNNTGDHSYSYKVEGIYDSWQPLNKNVLFMSALPYGQHKLMIRGRNAKGVLSKQLLEYDIIVRYPFYLQWWFILLVVLGVVITLRELWVGKTRRIEKRADELEAQVTERTQTIAQQADELMKLQELRSKFFANISHELRTPLTLIKGPLASLSRKHNADEDKEYLDLIAYNAELLHERIDDLLSLARADAGHMEVHLVPVQLHQFLDRLMDSHNGAARKKHIRLDLEDHLPASTRVMIDRKKLGQILSNFIGNAIKFSEPATTINLECTCIDETLQFCVTDQGPGIPQHALEKVFDRFFQVDKTHAEMGGTGIGLALAREFARVMDGKVWATSVEGQGSQFWLTVPFQLTEAIGDEQSVPVAQAVSSHELIPIHTTDPSATRIMLVEDNRSMRAFLEKELGVFNIDSYIHGQDALIGLRELAKKDLLPGLIISDVMMPVMNGFELLKQIRSEPALAGIPVVMLTARAAHEDKMEALRIGVDDYITKPFDTDELLVRIQNILSRIPAKRDGRNAIPAEEKAPDDLWLKELEGVLMQHVSDPNFNITQLAQALYTSESSLYRRVKAATGLTPNMYVREVRLFEARRLLESGEVFTVAGLSAAVGFETPDYFSRVYMQRFGHRPSERM